LVGRGFDFPATNPDQMLGQFREDAEQNVDIGQVF